MVCQIVNVVHTHMVHGVHGHMWIIIMNAQGLVDLVVKHNTKKLLATPVVVCRMIQTEMERIKFM